MSTVLTRLVIAALVTTLIAPLALGFDSGSDGSDGALDLTEPGTVDFFSLPLDHSDGIYNFTTVFIAEGVTLTLQSATRGPVTWLANGTVQIGGAVDIAGNPGHGTSSQFRSVPGAGGFSGGTGGNLLLAPTSGGGPGGGSADLSGDVGGGAAGHLLPADGTFGGQRYGNAFLLPLVGGSGGGGGIDGSSSSNTGPGGGAGGGALLIASSLLIDLASTSEINAGGGSAEPLPDEAGGGGSGGSIRLVAPTIAGPSGALLAALGGESGLIDGSPGRIRLEAYDNQFGGTIDPPATTGLPGVVSIPAEQTPLRIAQIDGVDVPAQPAGNFDPPDVVINSGSTVSVGLEARGIPLGTTVSVTMFTDTGETVVVESTPLTGTVELSTAGAELLIPNGFAGLFAEANWTP